MPKSRLLGHFRLVDQLLRAKLLAGQEVSNGHPARRLPPRRWINRGWSVTPRVPVSKCIFEGGEVDTAVLRDLLDYGGPFASVYFDGSHDTEDAGKELELRWRAIRKQLI